MTVNKINVVFSLNFFYKINFNDSKTQTRGDSCKNIVIYLLPIFYVITNEKVLKAEKDANFC